MLIAAMMPQTTTGPRNSSPSERRPATRSRTRESQGRRDPNSTAVYTAPKGDGNSGMRSDTYRTSKIKCVLCPSNVARQYCSQACHRGLRDSSLTIVPQSLDPACPNATRHSTSSIHKILLTSSTTCCSSSLIAIIPTRLNTLASVVAQERCMHSQYARMVTFFWAKAAPRRTCLLWFTNSASTKAAIHYKDMTFLSALACWS